MLTNLIEVISTQYVCIKITMLYTLDLHNIVNSIVTKLGRQRLT